MVESWMPGRPIALEMSRRRQVVAGSQAPDAARTTRTGCRQVCYSTVSVSNVSRRGRLGAPSVQAEAKEAAAGISSSV